MEFRLVYNGPLLSSNQRGGFKKQKATAIHDIRKELHPQLKALREVTPFLQEPPFGKPPLPHARYWGSPSTENSVGALAERFQVGGKSFVPLIYSDLKVVCELDILFLRNGGPGDLLQSGDLDNRLKSLFDALRCPKNEAELGDYAAAVDEQPLHCLLDDDSLITKFSVTSDRLLKPLQNGTDNDARIIIAVKTRPTMLLSQNAGFA